MHRFKLGLASCALVIMLITVFFTGTASAQSLHNSSAHQRAVAASCSYRERSNVSIWSFDGSTYLGYTIIWEGVCGSQLFAHEETISAVGSVALDSEIQNPSTSAFQPTDNATFNNTGSITFDFNQTTGYGCIYSSINFGQGDEWGCGNTFA